jgi:hypothetical protein
MEQDETSELLHLLQDYILQLGEVVDVLEDASENRQADGRNAERIKTLLTEFRNLLVSAGNLEKEFQRRS